MPATSARQPVRLYSRGIFLGYQRSKDSQTLQNALIKIEGVNQAEDAKYYYGKRIAYVYRAKNPVNGSHYKAIWGKVCRSHGTNGVVRAKFSKNMPPCAMGKYVRVMLYPNRD